MGFTLALEVDHLPIASSVSTTTTPSAHHPCIVLVPILHPHATVKSSLKKFIQENLYIPQELQSLSAPLFTKLSEQEAVEDIYSRYCCHADVELPDLHVDEETFTFFGREKGMSVLLEDEDKFDERHVIDDTKLQLKRLPQNLPEKGGRIFVETKHGTLPILRVSPSTQISEIKQTLENMTGIPVCQQLLSSVGRVMHDDLFVRDFDGLHTVYEDSTLDLCKSGDTNAEQAHRRMVVTVNVMGEQDFRLVVQGRDLVQLVMQVVESRTGYAQWQQRMTFSGKVLHEKKTLADYFIYPECTLQVSVFQSPLKPSPKRTACQPKEHAGQYVGNAEQKPAARKLKLLRTSKGQVKGTLTIPVLTTDTVFDLKRKIKRTLQPLVERNFSMRSPAKDQTHIDVTPRRSPANASLKPPHSLDSPSPSTGDSKLSRALSSSVQSLAKHLTSATSLNSPSRASHSTVGNLSSSQVPPTTPLFGGPPLRAPPAPSSVPPSSSSRYCSQLQEFPPSSLASSCSSIRRLHFEAASESSSSVLSPASQRGESCEPRKSAHVHTGHDDDMGSEGLDPSGLQDKKHFGAWLSGSMQTLRQQIRMQFVEN